MYATSVSPKASRRRCGIPAYRSTRFQRQPRSVNVQADTPTASASQAKPAAESGSRGDSWLEIHHATAASETIETIAPSAEDGLGRRTG
jgi:hypothetical protein